MSDQTSAETGVFIAPPTGRITLDHLRALVHQCEHLPGDTPVTGQIRIGGTIKRLSVVPTQQ